MSVKVNNLLLRLITGSEGSRFICIIDGSKKRIGLELLKTFISSSPNLGGHFLLLDNSVQCFELDTNKKLTVHQCLSTSNSCSELDILKSVPPGRELFIDSLNPLLCLYPEQSSKIIFDLKKKFPRIIALVSLEVLAYYGNPIIKDLADSIINLGSVGPNYEAIITHKKPSIRQVANLFKVVETFSISNNKFTYVNRDGLVNKTQKEPAEQTIEDLPFNLRSADEDNLVKKTKNSLSLKSNEGGKVYYEPGKEDDVDEEDPDEDLLI